MTAPRENFRLTPAEEQELEALAKLPDDRIDFSGILETLDSPGVRRGMFYRTS